MAQEEIIPRFDESDRDAAKEASENNYIMAAIGSQVVTKQLVEHASHPETPFMEKLQILKVLNDMAASSERAKRQVASEGTSGPSGPIINIFLEGEAEIESMGYAPADEEASNES
jgi:exonuclease III